MPVTSAIQFTDDRIARAMATEQRRYFDRNPASRALHAHASAHLPAGVPMHWMVRWPGDFPLHVSRAAGAHVQDADGHEIIDFCLGDTGAMTGHAPPAVVSAVAAQAARGFTYMLPTEDAAVVASLLATRFGLPYWQFALTATDANRFAIRLARHITHRDKVLVFNHCYHGSVDEALVTVLDGAVVPRAGSIGSPAHVEARTRVVEFNDLEALRMSLAQGDVACVLAEPALTNIGIVLPDAGFWQAAQQLARDAGTLLIIDETHTLCAGPGGCTHAWGLQPDIFTIGKAIGGGVPVAAYGFGRAVAEKLHAMAPRDNADTGGIGGTLAANALSMAATRATLEHVLTPQNFAHMMLMAEAWADGVQTVIDTFKLDWHVTRLGCRAEFWYRPVPMRNGSEAAASYRANLDAYLHLAALNRGILMTPFHNMALMCPDTTQRDIDTHTAVFEEIISALVNA